MMVGAGAAFAWPLRCVGQGLPLFALFVSLLRELLFAESKQDLLLFLFRRTRLKCDAPRATTEEDVRQGDVSGRGALQSANSSLAAAGAARRGLPEPRVR